MDIGTHGGIQQTSFSFIHNNPFCKRNKITNTLECDKKHSYKVIGISVYNQTTKANVSDTQIITSDTCSVNRR